MSGDTGTSLDEIRETFALFDDWEDKYRYLIDLGKDLAAMAAEQKVEANLVRGCQSQVWLLVEPKTNDQQQPALALTIDSDAHIVRGLAAVVSAALSGRTASDIVAFDAQALFTELELLQHLSPTRGNGLRAMVTKIQQAAELQLANQC